MSLSPEEEVIQILKTNQWPLKCGVLYRNCKRENNLSTLLIKEAFSLYNRIGALHSLQYTHLLFSECEPPELLFVRSLLWIPGAQSAHEQLGSCIPPSLAHFVVCHIESIIFSTKSSPR